MAELTILDYVLYGVGLAIATYIFYKIHEFLYGKKDKEQEKQNGK